MREDKTRYSINIGQYRIFIIKEVLCIRLEPDLATDCINRLSEYMYIYIIHVCQGFHYRDNCKGYESYWLISFTV